MAGEHIISLVPHKVNAAFHFGKIFMASYIFLAERPACQAFNAVQKLNDESPFSTLPQAIATGQYISPLLS